MSPLPPLRRGLYLTVRVSPTLAILTILSHFGMFDVQKDVTVPSHDLITSIDVWIELKKQSRIQIRLQTMTDQLTNCG